MKAIIDLIRLKNVAIRKWWVAHESEIKSPEAINAILLVMRHNVALELWWVDFGRYLKKCERLNRP